jgi:hypothetical protein
VSRLDFPLSLCFLFPYLRICLPYLFVLFNPCIPWLLVALLTYVAVCLAVSHMHYDIIQGLISCCIATLVRKILGGSRLVY